MNATGASCRALWLQVWLQGVDDAETEARAGNGSDVARRWIGSRDFTLAAELAGLDPDVARAVARKRVQTAGGGNGHAR